MNFLLSLGIKFVVGTVVSVVNPVKKAGTNVFTSPKSTIVGALASGALLAAGMPEAALMVGTVGAAVND